MGCSAALAEPTAPQDGAGYYLVLESDEASAARAERLWHEHAQAEGLTLRSVREPPPQTTTHETSPESLLVLSHVEAALSEARELSAQFREGAALAVLSQAEQQLLEALEVPHAHAFLAEVYLQRGLCAALLGEEGLAETSLAHALSLDPSRRVEAAEAPPATLALARRIASAHDVLLRSDSVLETQPSGAAAWLDGVPIENGSLHARAGQHVLVVQASGHESYANLVTLEPGRRPPVRVHLSRTKEEDARQDLQRAGSSVSGAIAHAKTLSATSGTAVYLVEPGTGPLPRALVHRCDERRSASSDTRAEDGCAQLYGLTAVGDPPRRFARQTQAKSWLRALPDSAERPAERRVWSRWPVWVAGAAFVAAGLTAALILREDPAVRRERQLEIDPGVPPR